MPTQPSTADQSKYRQRTYEPARILQASEVQSLQAMIGDKPSLNTYLLGGLFKTGATLNAKPVFTTVSGGISVSLAPINTGQPMLVYVNNRFEVFTSSTVTYSTAANGTVVSYYLNYVLWRVTYNGDSGSITDTTLVDAITNEAIAEVGQLQIYTGVDDSGAVNSAKMFDRNTSPLVMFQFTWSGGALTTTAQTAVQLGALAGIGHPGFVSTTTANPVVVSTDDTRNSDARNPLPASVNSTAASVPTPTGSNVNLSWTNETNASQSVAVPGITTSDTAGGVNSNRSWFSPWSVSVENALSFVWNRVTSIFGVLYNYGLRITALEGRPTVDYSWHVGQKLGRVGTNISTHPPVVDCTDPNSAYHSFQVISSPDWAFAALSGSTVVGGIDGTGNMQVTHPSYQDINAQSSLGINFTNYVTAARQLIGWIAGINAWKPTVQPLLGYTPVQQGGGIGQSANKLFLGWTGSAPRLTVDVTDIGNFAMQGWVNGLFATRTDGSWFCFKVGSNLEVAVGSGVINNLSQIPLPGGGFTYSQFKAMISPASINSNSSSANTEMSVEAMSVDGNGTVTMYQQGTDGVRWPHGGSPNSQTAQWMAFAWRTF